MPELDDQQLFDQRAKVLREEIAEEQPHHSSPPAARFEHAHGKVGEFTIERYISFCIWWVSDNGIDAVRCQVDVGDLGDGEAMDNELIVDLDALGAPVGFFLGRQFCFFLGAPATYSLIACQRLFSLHFRYHSCVTKFLHVLQRHFGQFEWRPQHFGVHDAV